MVYKNNLFILNPFFIFLHFLFPFTRESNIAKRNRQLTNVGKKQTSTQDKMENRPFDWEEGKDDCKQWAFAFCNNLWFSSVPVKPKGAGQVGILKRWPKRFLAFTLSTAFVWTTSTTQPNAASSITWSRFSGSRLQLLLWKLFLRLLLDWNISFLFCQTVIDQNKLNHSACRNGTTPKKKKGVNIAICVAHWKINYKQTQHAKGMWRLWSKWQ